MRIFYFPKQKAPKNCFSGLFKLNKNNSYFRCFERYFAISNIDT
ncbi:MAG: hypothetical protein K0S12_1476 [Bacteroidetes bacterium]|nr:hypothetical protein [Bacteroidota bacterium]